LVDADAGDGFEIVGHAFADPVVVIVDIGLGEVEHFVGAHPIIEQIGASGVIAEMEVDTLAVVFDAAVDSGAAGVDVDVYVLDGVSAVEVGDGGGGAGDPVGDVGPGEGKGFGGVEGGLASSAVSAQAVRGRRKISAMSFVRIIYGL
jgi:hypothetical protein